MNKYLAYGWVLAYSFSSMCMLLVYILSVYNFHNLFRTTIHFALFVWNPSTSS